jgi:hypothetical protein
MNARIAVVLVVLLVVMGGGALLIREQGAAQKPAAAGTLGQPLLKGLKAADVAAIAIREPRGTLTLKRRADRWTIAERADFPADLEKVRDFVLKAIDLKIGQLEPIGEKDRARLALDAGGTTIEFLDAGDKALARIVAGKKYFKREPDDPAKAAGDGRFVMLPEQAKTVFIVSDPLAQASSATADWIARAGFAIEKVKTLELRAADGSGWRLERADDNADWKLAGAKPDEKLEISKANAAAYSLSNVELADVAAKDLKAQDTGLEKPTTVSALTFDGLSYTLRIGRQQGESYYASLAIAGEPRPEGKDAEERIKRIGERLPRERALGEHVLLIAKSKLEDVLKKRAELLAAKEVKK